MRLKQLQTACAHPLRMLGTIDGGAERESLLHAVLKPHQMEGEWFRGNETVRGLIGLLIGDSPPPEPEPELPKSLHVWHLTATRRSGTELNRITFYLLSPGSDFPDLAAVKDSLAEEFDWTVDKVERICGFETLDLYFIDGLANCLPSSATTPMNHTGVDLDDGIACAFVWLAADVRSKAIRIRELEDEAAMNADYISGARAILSRNAEARRAAESSQITA